MPVSVQGVSVDFYINMDFASPQRFDMCTQPPIQWESGALSLGVNGPGREAEHSPSSSAEVNVGVELYPHSRNTPSWRGAQLKANAFQGLIIMKYAFPSSLMSY
jgi:hypothetical protein